MNSRPGSVTTAVVLIFVQSVFNLAAGVLGVVDIMERVDHNQKVTATMHILGWGSLVATALLVLSGVLLLRGTGGARVLVAVLEAFTLLGGVVSLASGAPQAVLGMTIAVVILVLLFNSRSSAWFTRSRAVRSGY